MPEEKHGPPLCTAIVIVIIWGENSYNINTLWKTEKHGLQIFMSNKRQIKNLMGHSVDLEKLYSWKESNVVACQGTV